MTLIDTCPVHGCALTLVFDHSGKAVYRVCYLCQQPPITPTFGTSCGRPVMSADLSDALAVIAAEYGIDADDVHGTLMGRRAVRALCAAVDLAILRGHLDPRSLIADARLVVSDPDCPGDEPELLRRIACTRPNSEREQVAAAHGEDNFR